MTVTDMGSELGTKINGRQVQRCRVAAGDRLGLGGITLIAETTATDMANNPFLSTAPAVPVDAVWSQDTEGLDEPGPDAVDVRILWGTNVLHFAQLCPPRAFTLGAVGCDFVLPDGDADDAAKSLVELRDGRPVVLVPNGGSATVRRVNGSCHTASGGEIELPHGAVATVRRPGSELVFEVSHVRAGSKPTAAFWEGTDLSAQAYTGISALIHGSLFGALAFFLPAMHSDDAETVDRDVAAAMQPYLAAIAEKEPAHEESVAELTHEAANGGGSGSQAAKESGGMGNPLSHASSPARYGIRGDTPEPKLARERALLEAAKFGMVGLLNTDGPESANAPIAAWADDRAVGHDAKSALGSMWGPSVDDVFGPGGLGLSGAGEGGGGVGTGIGIDGIADTVGHGSGDWPGGDGPGRGPGTGFGPAGRGGPGGLRDASQGDRSEDRASEFRALPHVLRGGAPLESGPLRPRGRGVRHQSRGCRLARGRRPQHGHARPSRGVLCRSGLPEPVVSGAQGRHGPGHLSPDAGARPITRLACGLRRGRSRTLRAARL